MSVLLETTVGDIVVDLEISSVNAAIFLTACQQKIFNNAICEKIEKNYLCFFGLGPHVPPDDVFIRSTVRRESNSLKHSLGSVSWSSDSIDGGIYFTFADSAPSLDKSHGIFGKVVEGIETLADWNDAHCDDSGRPFLPLRIKHTVILESIPEACEFDCQSPAEIVDEPVSPDGEDIEILQERKEAALAASRAVGLELMGDLPSAEVRPPENVLFVCKLNPVTDDEDLRVIFSRFGQVVNCDIIRDTKTGDSLQYAFVEFENNEVCERAFLGMQNVIVDDRRIKVDFSQSASKEWTKFRSKNAQNAVTSRHNNGINALRDRSRSRDRSRRANR